MRVWICGLAAAFALGAVARAAPPPKVVTQPDWVEKPKAEDLQVDFPLIAQKLAIEGSTVIGCRVDSFGRLGECKVVAEAPAGLGFGAGAIAMTRHFRMRPMTRGGAPVEGASIRIPIVFRLPPQTPQPLPALTPADPTRVALARGLVSSLAGGLDVAGGFATVADQIEFTHGAASPETQSAAAAALRAAAHAHGDEVLEAEAQVYASILSERELRALAAARASPAWAVISPGLYVHADDAMLQRNLSQHIRDETREGFCRTRNCDPAGVVAAPTQATIENPAWLETPTPAAALQAAPKLARFMGLPGAVRMRCTVDAGATLSGCEVAGEAPAGLGFGQAALELARLYRLDYRLMAEGARGETVAISLVFPAQPPEVAPFAPLMPRSPRALALARAYLTAGGFTRGLDPERLWAGIVPNAGEPTDPQAAADARAAFRVAVNHANAAYGESLAAIYAAHFTEDQLAAAEAVSREPAMQAFRAKKPLLNPALLAVAAHVAAAITKDAHAAFCSAHPCEASLPTPTPASVASSTR